MTPLVDDSSRLVEGIAAAIESLRNGGTPEGIPYLPFYACFASGLISSNDVSDVLLACKIDSYNLQRFQETTKKLMDLFEEERRITKLALLQEHQSETKNVLDQMRELNDAYKEMQAVSLLVIDKLISERRVQEVPARKIQRALKHLFDNDPEVISKIEFEIQKLDANREMAVQYVRTIEHFARPNPELEQLKQISGYAKSTWSKGLNKTPLLLEIRESLGKKARQAKEKRKKELWAEADKFIEDRLIAVLQKAHKGRMRTMQYGEDPGVLGSDRKRDGVRIFAGDNPADTISDLDESIDEELNET